MSRPKLNEIPDATVQAAWKESGEVVAATAKKLGVPASTLHSRLQRMGIERSGPKHIPHQAAMDSEWIERVNGLRKAGMTFDQVAIEMGYGRKDSFMRRVGQVNSRYGQNTIAIPIEPYNIPYRTQTYDLDHEFTAVVFTDPHFWPDQTSPAFWILLEILQHVQPELILCCGDVVDGARISRHPRIGWEDRPSFIDELEAAQEHMKLIAEVSPDSDREWTLGNHDMRFENFLSSHIGELEGLKGTRLSDHFPAWNLSTSIFINQTLYGQHAWRGGRYAAYNNALQSGASHISGHLHTLWHKAITDLRGVRYGICAGTLAWPASPQFTYLQGNPTDWQCGLYVIHFAGQRITPEPVLVGPDGVAVWSGRSWRG